MGRPELKAADATAVTITRSGLARSQNQKDLTRRGLVWLDYSCTRPAVGMECAPADCIRQRARTSSKWRKESGPLLLSSGRSARLTSEDSIEIPPSAQNSSRTQRFFNGSKTTRCERFV